MRAVLHDNFCRCRGCKPPLPSYTNAYQAAVYGRRRKVTALIALFLVCAASLYRGIGA
jgi:hypothetical protein